MNRSLSVILGYVMTFWVFYFCDVEGYLKIAVYYWCVDLFIVLLIFWCFDFMIYWFIDLLIYWFIDLLIYWFIDLLTYWFIDLLIYWLIDLLFYWFINWLIYWFIYLFIYLKDFHQKKCMKILRGSPNRAGLQIECALKKKKKKKYIYIYIYIYYVDY